MSLPKFSGWRALDITERTRDGDVFVRVTIHGGDKQTPETGDRVMGSEIGKSVSDCNGTSWHVYRRDNATSIPRRLIGSRMFSSPLPLP